MFSTKIRHSIQLMVAALAGFFPVLSAAQTCTEPTASQFRVVTLVPPSTAGSTAATGLGDGSGAYGPVGMSIAADGRVFIAKMQTGQIVVYKPSAPNVSSAVGQIATYANTEDGVLGIVLDNNFMSNRWMYVFYSDPCGLNCTNRAMELARFTLDTTVAGTTTGLGQLTNKKIILRFPRATDDNHHAAGGLSFDANGVLVIGVGDNTDPHDGTNNGFGPINFSRIPADAQRTSANTNDLRGKVLRIKPIAFADAQTPTPGVDNTYSIPTGNLWEKINNVAFNPGWKNDSDDISKVRKEIYVMGNRNPFHPRVDSRSGWIFWGEIGPDQGTQALTGRGPTGHDEFNLATGTGFFGHPYCNGYNVPYGSRTAPATTYGSLYDCNTTGNTSLTPLINKSPNNTGIFHLPKPVPALAAYASGNSTDDDVRFSSGTNTTTISHGSESAIGGPMYRYDVASTSTVKWPPYYEGKVFFFDWARRNFRTIHLDSNGNLPAGVAGVHLFPNSGTLTGLVTASYLDAQYGPDGALYLLKFSGNNYGDYTPALYRVEYTGTYDNACYRPFDVTVLGPGATQGTTSIANRQTLRKSISPVLANGFLTLPTGYKTVELYNVSGRKVWSYHRENADRQFEVRLPADLTHGILQAKLLP